nr:hypothetical protein [Tanacetum cinerariifolium]GEW22849.1 hypothetical protein [Tanacetum cinerariifolium]
MWEAIERLQQGESLNIQDVKTNLFWEFRKFTSNDGETMESYYTRFYKLMNEMIRNNLTVTTMQINVQFLQQLQLELSRVVTIVKQQHKLDEVSCHKLFGILKQYQNEVNELRPEKLARNANPLALVANAQASQDPFYQSSRPHRSQAPSPKPSIPTRSHTSTRHKGKEIAKTINVVAAREKVGSRVVQKSGIQCFNCKEYGHFAKECRKPKGLRTPSNTDDEVDEQELEAHYSYMAKIQEVPNADSCTDSEPVEQVQKNAEYNVFANGLQHSEQSESNDQNDVEIDDERVMLANFIANLKLDVDENKKIQKQLKKANTTLAQEMKECKDVLAEISKSLGESISVRDSCLVALQTNQTELTMTNLNQEMHADLNYVESLKKEINKLKSEKAEFSDMYDVILHDCVSKDVMCSYLQSLSDLDVLAELQCMYLHTVKECDCLAQKLSKQTESVSKKAPTELLQRFANLEKHSMSLEIALQKCKEQVKNDTIWNEKALDVFRKECEQYFKIQDLKAQIQNKNIAISELKKLIEKGKGKYVDTKFDRPSVV